MGFRIGIFFRFLFVTYGTRSAISENVRFALHRDMLVVFLRIKMCYFQHFSKGKGIEAKRVHALGEKYIEEEEKKRIFCLTDVLLIEFEIVCVRCAYIFVRSYLDVEVSGCRS